MLRKLIVHTLNNADRFVFPFPVMSTFAGRTGITSVVLLCTCFNMSKGLPSWMQSCRWDLLHPLGSGFLSPLLRILNCSFICSYTVHPIFRTRTVSDFTRHLFWLICSITPGFHRQLYYLFFILYALKILCNYPKCIPLKLGINEIFMLYLCCVKNHILLLLGC